ncbi:MAG: hypothetical protein CMP22_07325 [Rickettsiales bacterium]|nr:hypothetical protein [Rickettsiales bacterium]
MLNSYDFKVRINGVAYDLVKGFSFSRDMSLMGSSFKLDLVDPDHEILKIFRPGVKAQIEIDGVEIARAWLEVLSISDAKGTVYTYSGRDAFADLIDCSAVFSDGSFSKKKISLEKAIADLIKPYGLAVKKLADTGKLFDSVTITPGETVANVITRLCKYRAIFPYSDGVSNLLLAKPSDIKSGGRIYVTSEESNILTRAGQISHVQRFSKVTVKGSNNGLSDWASATPTQLSQNEGVAFDPDIKRHRPLIIQAESDGYDIDHKERAVWEVRHRRFSGTEISYTLPGWSSQNGDLWKMNSLIEVIDEDLFIHRNMLIKGIELTRDDDGTKTKITVAPSEAYDIPATKQEDKDDALWGGGA